MKNLIKNFFIREGLIFFLLFISLLFFTSGLKSGFFQQDEWNAFGIMISYSQKPFWTWFGLITGQHAAPFGALFWNMLYKAFGFESYMYAYVALLLHTVAAYFVFRLIRNLSNNTIIAFFTSLLFCLNDKTGQAYLHLAVFSSAVTSLIFMLLFFLYLTKIKSKIISLSDSIILSSLFIISVFFREDGFMIIPLAFVYLFIYRREWVNRKNYSAVSVFTISFLIILGHRLYLQITSPIAAKAIILHFLHIYIYNFVTLPIRLLTQNIFNSGDIFDFFWKNKLLIYPPENLDFTLGVMFTVFMDLIMLVLANIIIITIFVLKSFSRKDKQCEKNIVFIIFWIMVNSMFIATVGRYIYIVDPRYLYSSSIMVNFLLVQTFYNWINASRKNLIRKMLKSGLFIFVLAIMLNMSYINIQKSIKAVNFQSIPRKKIFNELKRLYPVIPQNAIFFVRCKIKCQKNDYYFVSPKYVLPYTSGPGWIFLLQYARENKAYSEFFTRVDGKEFLWDLGSEGYRQIGEYGYGYFIDLNNLKNTIVNYQLNKNIVIGIEYDETDFSLNDISEEIHKIL